MTSLSSRNSDLSSGSKSSKTSSSHSFPTSPEICWSMSFGTNVSSSSVIPIFSLIAFKISGNDIRLIMPRSAKLMSLKATNNVDQSFFSTFFINLGHHSNQFEKNFFSFQIYAKKNKNFFLFCSQSSFDAGNKSEVENILLRFASNIWIPWKKQAQKEWRSSPKVCKCAPSMQTQEASRKNNFLLHENGEKEATSSKPKSNVPNTKNVVFRTSCPDFPHFEWIFHEALQTYWNKHLPD